MHGTIKTFEKMENRRVLMVVLLSKAQQLLVFASIQGRALTPYSRKRGNSQIDHVGRSEANLGSSPVSSLGIVSDFIVSSVPDPVGQRSVFLHHMAHFYLSA